MFERYTEKARRVIFFARYEASQFGSPSIESEHILLGLVREDKALANRFLRSQASLESIRKQVEGRTVIREKVSTSVDLPLAKECKRILAYAAEEAERLGHLHIGTEHILLGLLREEKCFAAEMLAERGVRIAGVREEIQLRPHVINTPHAPPRPALDPLIPIRFVDATTSEGLFVYNGESPWLRVPGIGETVEIRLPDAKSSPGRLFRVEDITSVYVAAKALPNEISGLPTVLGSLEIVITVVPL